MWTSVRYSDYLDKNDIDLYGDIQYLEIFRPFL